MRSSCFAALIIFAVLVLGILGSRQGRAQASQGVSLMPLPARMQLGGGALKINETFNVFFAGYREARLDRSAGAQESTGVYG